MLSQAIDEPVVWSEAVWATAIRRHVTLHSPNVLFLGPKQGRSYKHLGNSTWKSTLLLPWLRDNKHWSLHCEHRQSLWVWWWHSQPAVSVGSWLCFTFMQRRTPCLPETFPHIQADWRNSPSHQRALRIPAIEASILFCNFHFREKGGKSGFYTFLQPLF